MEEEFETGTSRLIKDLDANERPREKAIKYGIDSLTNAELMALIFSTGIQGKSVIDVCRDILKDNNGRLTPIVEMSIKELCRKYKGIGVAKATTLLAGLTLGRRAAQERDAILASETASDPERVYYSIRHRFTGLQHEEFWVAAVNRGGKIINEMQVSRGGTAATTVDVKIILKFALNQLASSIFLFHNHPSGTLAPSIEDDKLTTKITEAAKMVDIYVMDHIIISDNGYYSYAEHGRL